MTIQEIQKELAEATSDANTAFSRGLDPTTKQKALERVMTLERRLQQARSENTLTAEIDRLTGGRGTGGDWSSGRSFGAQFVRSPAGAFLREKKHLGVSHWETPVVELTPPGGGMMSATLTEDAASGGGLVVPMYDTQIRPLPSPRPRLLELFAQGRATSNLVNTMTETVATNAADAVAEGAAKPESTLTFTVAGEPVRKIATFIPITDEMLEDVAQIASYLDARLIGFVRTKLDSELLSGSGVAPHLTGIMNRTLATAVPQGAMTAVDAIGLQIATLATANEDLYLPDAVLVNPLDLTKMLQAKMTTGEYIAASPFASTTTPTLWGLPAIPMSGMPAGQALVGAFKSAAQVYLRGPIQVAVSNSHQDWFVKDLVAVRAEVRAALAVYRGQAFGKVTGITFA